MCGIGLDAEPLCTRRTLHMLLVHQIAMEIMIGERLKRTIQVHGRFGPAKYCRHVDGVALLVDAIGNRLRGRIPDLRPAIVGRNRRRLIGVNHRADALEGFDVRRVAHGHFISFTFFSMKSISSSVRLYFLYSCLSMSATDWDQSISEDEVKSWRGTYLNTRAVIS